MNEILEMMWEDIPVGSDNAVTYNDLVGMWGIDRRAVRYRLHELATTDFGDGLVLIRSSHNKGFYKTDDIDDILMYKREIISRAQNVMRPAMQIDRVLGSAKVVL